MLHQSPSHFTEVFTSENGHFILEEENSGNGRCKKLLGGQVFATHNGLASFILFFFFLT